MVKLKRERDKDQFAFDFSDIDQARAGLLAAIGGDVRFWSSRLKARLRSMTDRQALTLSAFPRIAIVKGLLSLVGGEPMGRSIELAWGGVFIALFMRAYDAADECGRKALLEKWKDGLNQEAHFVNLLFELMVGMMYVQWDQTAHYHDLGNGQSNFDWKINPGEQLECWVEAKSTSWSTQCPLDSPQLRECQGRIERFLDVEKITAFSGIIRLTYRGRRSEKADGPIRALDELLSRDRPSVKRSVGQWTLEFRHRGKGFNGAFREDFKTGRRPTERLEMDLLTMPLDGSGPVCGISFDGGWDHSQAIINNLRKALSQVKTAPMSIVWVQMSGMPTTLADLKNTALVLQSRDLARKIDEVAGRPEHYGYVGYQLALDPVFSFEDDQPRFHVRLPNVALPNVRNLKLWAAHHGGIMGRDVNRDFQNMRRRLIKAPWLKR